MLASFKGFQNLHPYLLTKIIQGSKNGKIIVRQRFKNVRINEGQAPINWEPATIISITSQSRNPRITTCHSTGSR